MWAGEDTWLTIDPESAGTYDSLSMVAGLPALDGAPEPLSQKSEVKPMQQSDPWDDDGDSAVWSSSTPSSLDALSGAEESGEDVGSETPPMTEDLPMCVDQSMLDPSLTWGSGCQSLQSMQAESSQSSAETETSQPAAQGNLAVQTAVDNLNVGCTFDLRTHTWQTHEVALLPNGIHLPDSRGVPFHSMVSKGRQSREERESERCAQELLRTPGWLISNSSNFEDIECLLVALTRWLVSVTKIENTPLEWCIGGSIDATLRARDPSTGTSHILRFALCDRSDWTGDRKTTKVGNTCRWHAGGLTASNITINGSFHQRIILRKCTWMKCCYGRKHYGDPPNVPWCNTCEYQKKHAKKSRDDKGPTQPSTSSCGVCNTSVTSRPQAEPCNECLQRLLSQAGRIQPCGSCMKILERVEMFVDQLAQSRCGAAEAANFARLARANAMGVDGASSNDAAVNGAPPLAQPPSNLDLPLIKHAVLRLLAAANLRAQAQHTDPILIDALLHRFSAPDFITLWTESAKARTALSRIALADMAMASQIHRGLHAIAEHMPPSDTVDFLRRLPVHTFLTCWQAAGASRAQEL